MGSTDFQTVRLFEQPTEVGVSSTAEPAPRATPVDFTRLSANDTASGSSLRRFRKTLRRRQTAPICSPGHALSALSTASPRKRVARSTPTRRIGSISVAQNSVAEFGGALDFLQCLALGFKIRVSIAVGCVEAGMPKPAAYHRYVNARCYKADRC